MDEGKLGEIQKYVVQMKKWLGIVKNEGNRNGKLIPHLPQDKENVTTACEKHTIFSNTNKAKAFMVVNKNNDIVRNFQRFFNTNHNINYRLGTQFIENRDQTQVN